MKSNQIVPILLILCLSFCASELIPSASGQSPADLRNENQRLKTENEELKRELEAARVRIAALERSVANLTKALESAYQGHIPEGATEEARGPGSVDESVPTASPRALFNALVKSYEETLGTSPTLGEPRSRERRQFVQSLQQWRGSVLRQHRDQIEWHVRVEEAEAIPSGYSMRMVAIDPKNEAELGDAFEVHLPRGHARLYEQRVAQGEPGLFVLRGMLVPNVQVNENRPAPGPFDRPPLIGPFAEFSFTIESRSLTPAEDDEP